MNQNETTNASPAPIGPFRRASLLGAALCDYADQPDVSSADLSRYLAGDFRRELRRAEEAIADALPHLSEADVIRLCNGDHAVQQAIESWRNSRWSIVDVSDLPDEGDEGNDGWTITNAGRGRYEVREVPLFEARPGNGCWFVHNSEENDDASDGQAAEACGFGDVAAYTEEQARAVAEYMTNDTPDAYRTVWIVVDTEAHAPTGGPGGHGFADARDSSDFTEDDYDPTDEDSAREAADRANVDDYRENACGWPFAHNYAAQIDERYAEDFAACGFVVALHEPSGQHYAGIDGGGYSFTDAHWAPLYLRWHLHGRYSPEHVYLETNDGLRRVNRSGAE